MVYVSTVINIPAPSKTPVAVSGLSIVARLLAFIVAVIGLRP
jgi:hypothetical protein